MTSDGPLMYGPRMYGPRMYGPSSGLGGAPVDAAVAVVLDRDRDLHGASSWVVVSWAGPGRVASMRPFDELPDVGPVADALQRAVRGGLLGGAGLAQRGARLRGRQRRARPRRAARPARRRARRRPSARRSRCRAKRARVPGVLVLAGPRLVGAAAEPAGGGDVAAPALGVERACPSWRSAGASGRGRGGRRAARPRRRGSSRSRARRAGTGSGRCGRKPGPGPA